MISPRDLAGAALAILQEVQYLLGEVTAKISLLPDVPAAAALHRRASEMYDEVKSFWHDVNVHRSTMQPS